MGLPNARVPTIEDGDFVLWESNSIMRYLCMKYGGEAFYPADPAARSSWEVRAWMNCSRGRFPSETAIVGSVQENCEGDP